MNSTELKDPVLAHLKARRPSVARYLKRNASTGCLEYKGPPGGRNKGNPVLTNWDGKTSVHLRRYLFEAHKGSLPKGKFPSMKCRNPICHEYLHMEARDEFGPYSPSSKLYTQRFSREMLNAIRYYGKRVPKSVVADVFRIKTVTAFGITKSKMGGPLPKNWRPSQALERKVELSSIKARGMHFYLCPATRRLALKDIRSSSLPPLEKAVLSSFVTDVPIKKTIRLAGHSRNGTVYIFRRALARLSLMLGEDRRWIFIAGKGQAAKWRSAPYA
jgi:hypothetical protein